MELWKAVLIIVGVLVLLFVWILLSKNNEEGSKGILAFLGGCESKFGRVRDLLKDCD